MKKQILSAITTVTMMFSVVGVMSISAVEEKERLKTCGECDVCIGPVVVSYPEGLKDAVSVAYNVTNEILSELVESGKIPLSTKTLFIGGGYCDIESPLGDDGIIGIPTVIPLSDITPLSKLKNLEYFALGDSLVGDLSPLSGLTNLNYIDLRGNDGIINLSPLKELKNLKTLYVSYTPVSLKQIKALRAALPELRIFYNANLDNNNLLGMLGIGDVLEIFQYLVGLPSVFDNPSPDIFLIFVLETNEPTIFDAVDILEALVGL
ncbi:MAG: hypothetical protein FWF94_05380 [Oscillospiraceae bacterium]|nr:hypothetical protein [Oscillospiraceae bacterium]